MTSKETDLADRRARQRQVDQTLAADRAGRDRLRDQADVEVEPSHGDRSADTPNTYQGARPR